MGLGGVACPKGPKRSTIQERKARAEAARIQIVRPQCVDRDGFCRLSTVQALFGSCIGVSEWAHLWDKKRCFTRGMSPEQRHDAMWTAQFCTRHHTDEERKRIRLDALTQRGADGQLRVRRGDIEAIV